MKDARRHPSLAMPGRAVPGQASPGPALPGPAVHNYYSILGAAGTTPNRRHWHMDGPRYAKTAEG